MAVLLGCIADDFTGGTDLAGMLVKAGMRTVQLIGVPGQPVPDDADAVVIALKSRTIPAGEAVAQSLQALRWLRQAGCRQFYFKYCSTFDSTPRGNIGPVAEALMRELGTDFTVACPAFPANGRTVYNGYLFVGDILLSESGMRDHPLTPMTDPSLVRVLQAQSSARVGLVGHGAVAQGPAAIVDRCAALKAEGCGLAVVDALEDADLLAIGRACADLPLVTGASGMALGLPGNFRRLGLLPAVEAASALPATEGLRAVVAGSCSTATRRQVEVMRERAPAFYVDAQDLFGGIDVVAAALDWASRHVHDGPVLVYSSSGPDVVRGIQERKGADFSGAAVEDALARIATGLVGLGVGQMIVAGGETSGAVVRALGVSGLRIGPEIDPGVPWTVAMRDSAEAPLALALKSGNFGSDDFFMKAWRSVP